MLDQQGQFQCAPHRHGDSPGIRCSTPETKAGKIYGITHKTNTLFRYRPATDKSSSTSGTGTRGTFFFTTAPFDDVASLRVFELSAEDGSRIHEVEIPLQAAQ